MLRPLPYPDGDRFVVVYGARTNEPGVFSSFSIPEAQEFERQNTTFDAFGVFRGRRVKLTTSGEPQFVQGASLTSALARELGSPALGHWFADNTSVVISTS